MKDKIEQVLNEVFEPDKDSPLWMCAQLSGDIETIRTICNKVWNAAVEECAKEARTKTETNWSGDENWSYEVVDRDSILSLKIEDDEK